jgi:hypothetical protein
MLSMMVSLVVLIVYNVRKRNRKRPGIIALASFAVFMVVSFAGSQFYPSGESGTRARQDAPEEYRDTQEPTDDADRSFGESEIIVSPKAGKKLKVMGTTLTLRINISDVKDESLEVSLLANGAIPLIGMDGGVALDKLKTIMDGTSVPVRIKIVTGNQTIESSSIHMHGIIGDGALHMGHLVFIFPTTKVPDAVLVYNEDGKSVRYKVKIKN